jgi:hypothetical protein
MVLIIALFGFAIAIGLLCLAITGAILTVALGILTAILWVAVKILEHRKAAAPEILIIVEAEHSMMMRDVTPCKSTRQLKAE